MSIPSKTVKSVNYYQPGSRGYLPHIATPQTRMKWGDHGYAMGPRATAQQSAAENRLIQGLRGDVDTARFNPVMDYLGREMQSNLQTQVLPGIRQQMVQYQPGGSSRGDLVQRKAIETANQQMLDKASQLTYGAYSDAQDRAQDYAGLYPSFCR